MIFAVVLLQLHVVKQSLGTLVDRALEANLVRRSILLPDTMEPVSPFTSEQTTHGISIALVFGSFVVLIPQTIIKFVPFFLQFSESLLRLQ